MSPHPSTRLAAAAALDAGVRVAFHPIARLHVDLGRVTSAACQPFGR
jgi:hypothetical protein